MLKAIFIVLCALGLSNLSCGENSETKEKPAEENNPPQTGEFAVIESSPAQGDVDVPESTQAITIRFNRSVNSQSMEGDLNPANTEYTMEWTEDSTLLTIHFPFGLEQDVTYTIDIFRLLSADGASLSAYQLCFSTSANLHCRSQETCQPVNATDQVVPLYEDVPYKGIFADQSPFNLPIGENPTLHGDNAEMMATLSQVLQSAGGIWMGTVESTVPIYITDETTPKKDVTITAATTGATLLKNVPILDGAITDCGPDRFFVTYDAANNRFFELYRSEVDSNGQWSAQNGNAISMESNGIYEGDNHRSTVGIRASGFSLAAGLIWPHELASGEIRHALLMGYSQIRTGAPLPPATASDGQIEGSGAIPMGARIQLDPSINLDTMDLTPVEKTIATALQIYGAFIGDTAGGVSLSFVNPYSFRGNPYEDFLPTEAATDGGFFWNQFSASDFRVLTP